MNSQFKKLIEIESKITLVQMAISRLNQRQEAMELKERNRQRKEIDLPPLTHDVYLSDARMGHPLLLKQRQQ
jgi:hypothetical protein